VEVDEDLQTAARRAVTEETLRMSWSPSRPADEAEKDQFKHFVSWESGTLHILNNKNKEITHQIESQDKFDFCLCVCVCCHCLFVFVALLVYLDVFLCFFFNFGLCYQRFRASTVQHMAVHTMLKKRN